MATRSLTALLLVVCLIGACTDDPATPDEDAPPTSTASGEDRSTSPVEDGGSEPSFPDDAAVDSLKGAEAFVRHYIDLLNYAANTGDIRALQRVSSRECSGCKTYEDLYRATYENGGYMREPGWTPTDLFAADEGAGSVGVLVTVRAPRMRYKLSADSKEKFGAADVYKLRFGVSRRSGAWVVNDFDLQVGIDDLQ